MKLLHRAGRVTATIRTRWKGLLLLLVLFLIAFVIRAIGIERGIPSQNQAYSLFYTDELAVMDASLSLGNREYAYVNSYISQRSSPMEKPSHRASCERRSDLFKVVEVGSA